MQRLFRPALPSRAVRYLQKKQEELRKGADPRTTWNYARKAKTMDSVFASLVTMTGERSRCVFCADSRGMEIDHFQPIAGTNGMMHVFEWENLLLICGGCNRLKSDQFECDNHGRPLLINPTAEEPWEFLFFECNTGILTAKYDLQTQAYDPKGVYTTDEHVLPLNVDAITTGRRRVYRQLQRAVQRFMDEAEEGGDVNEAKQELLVDIRDHNDYGLVAWCFAFDGCKNTPFRRFVNDYTDVKDYIIGEIGER